MRTKLRLSGSRAFVILVILAAATACAERSADPPVATGKVQSAVVGGDIEPGWPSVGALTLRMPGYGYLGTFCSGTLIAPSWVLTAAHCVTPDPSQGFDPQPENMMFYVGPDARRGAGGWPTEGTLHEVDAIFPHPQYSSIEQSDDIGLVHLTEPVAEVPPIPFNVSVFREAWLGVDVFYVGYGVDDGDNHTGEGVRRSTTLAVYAFYPTTYYTRYVDSNVCFGDSGGPGLMELDGEWQIVGVVSGGTAENCMGGYDVATRVDAYAEWLSDVTGSPLPTCLEVPGMCACPDACQEDGTCANGVCRDFDCGDQFDCYVGCPTTDEDCRQVCRDRGTDEAAPLFAALEACFAVPCAGGGYNFGRCVNDNCPAEQEACMPRPVGDLTCREVYDCTLECADYECSGNCSNQGTIEAQDLYRALRRCLRHNCNDATTDAEYQTCIREVCVAEINACLPPADCDLLGGACPDGKACYVRGPATTDCGASLGLEGGAACEIEAPDALPCGDGLVCRPVGEAGGACASYCRSDDDCADGAHCEIPVDAGVPDVGACVAPPVEEPDAGGADGGDTADVAETAEADATGGDDGATDPDDAAGTADAGSTGGTEEDVLADAGGGSGSVDPPGAAGGDTVAGDDAGGGSGSGGSGCAAVPGAGAGGAAPTLALFLIALAFFRFRRTRTRARNVA